MATLDSTIALIDLADLKEFLKISGTGEDSLLNALINECSQAVVDFLGRPIISATYTEFYDGPSGGELMLDKYPIISVTTLNDDTDRAFGSADDIDISADVLIDKEGGTLRLWNNESAFTQGQANVKVVYSAGYALADVPASIQLAVKRWCAAHYMKHIDRRHDIASETVGDSTTTFIVEKMPQDVAALLRPFKKRGYATEFISA